ncbi:MAG: LEPR-XLL domain-containing protein, partial [Verrucomicrobiota bacterium]
METLEPRVLLSADAVLPATPVEGPMNGSVGDSASAIVMDFSSEDLSPLLAESYPVANIFPPSSETVPNESGGGNSNPADLPFEFQPANGKSLDATLRVDGQDLLLIDNSSQKVLKRQELYSISKVVITGSEDNDVLKIDRSEAKTWFSPIAINLGGESDATGDRLELVENSSAETTYKPDTKGGGRLSLLEITAATPDDLSFNGVELLVVSGSSFLKVVTPDSADSLTVSSPAAGKTRISGDSGKHEIVPVTFSGVENVLLDAAANDSTSTLLKIPVIKGYVTSPDDMITIRAGAMQAAGLKNFTIETGSGSDSLMVLGTNFSLPVAGGVFGFNGGSGKDWVFARDAEASGSVDANGHGQFVGTSGQISLTAVEKFQEAPERPVVLVPGFGGSFAVDSAVGTWFSQVGLPPDQLQIEPIAGTYSSLIKTLENAGYKRGETLFLAVWDWRLPLAPIDADADGRISDVTGASLADEVYRYGVDYLGHSLKQAAAAWSDLYEGAALPSVDIVAHGAGGLIARAYIQSTGYGGSYSGGTLPVVNNFVGVGVPNRGMVSPWILLNDEWGQRDETKLLALTLDLAYTRILLGGRISTPHGDISLGDITDDLTILGQPEPTRFISHYLPALRDLLPTFDFVDDGTGTLADLNTNLQLRNNFLLDLNDGLDWIYAPGETVPFGRNPNRFISEAGHKILGVYTAVYSEEADTAASVLPRSDSAGTRVSFTNLLGRPHDPGEVWFDAQLAPASGDTAVTGDSAIGQVTSVLVDSGAVAVKKIGFEQGGTLGISHDSMMADLAVKREVMRAVVGDFLDSDISSSGRKPLVSRAAFLVKTAVHYLMQPDKNGQPLSGPAAITVFNKSIGNLAGLASDLLADALDSDGDGNKDVTVPEFTVPLSILSEIPGIKDILKIEGLALTFSDLKFSENAGAQGGMTFSATVTLEADAASFLPKDGRLVVVAEALSGTFSFSSAGFERFEISVGKVRIQIKDWILIQAENFALKPYDQIVVSVATITAGIPKLNLFGSIHGLEITRDGGFFIVGASLSFEDPDNPDGTGLLDTLGLGNFLPLDLTGAAIKFSGDTNDNNVRDPGEVFDLTAFDLTVRGSFHPEFFESFPFTPIVRVGPQEAAKPGDELSFTVTLKDGLVVPKTIGPITLGFRDLKIGKITFGASITLGGYQDGEFVPEFGGYFKIESGLEQLTGSAQVLVDGSFDPATGTLSISGGLQVGFKLKDGLLSVQDARLDFGMNVTAHIGANGSFNITVAPLPGKPGFLDKLSVGLIEVKLGQFLTLQARNTSLDFNATGHDPLISFGGSPPANLDPNAVFNPTTVPYGFLSAVFGASAGPLNGWGGSVGNFAIGADLSFQLLNGFFIELKVGPNAKFGLPSFLPVQLKSVKIKFNDGAIANGELIEPSNFSFIVSGGVVEKPSWPIFGEFSGLKVNVQKLIDGDLLNAIENLNGFSIGVRDVKIGGVKLSGALALGLVHVDTDNDGVEEAAFYARLGGKFFYSGIGGGIDIVFSQYGPILATISAGGLVEPTTGFVFGFKDAGFTFGGEPLPSVTDPAELLENPIFYNPTTINLAEIESRVRQAMIAAQPTWNRSFTLTGTGTLTNTYVQGLISGELTIAANIGFQGPDAGLKIIASGSIDVFGLSMARAAALWDFSNILSPKIDMAFKLPAPDNPIGFLFPSEATLTATLDYKGVGEAPVVGLGVFFEKLSAHALATGQQLFESVLDSVAADLQADHDQRLSLVLLDWDGNGVLSEVEDARVITREFITDRALGNASAGIPGILVTDFGQLLAMPPEVLAAKITEASALIRELLPAIII